MKHRTLATLLIILLIAALHCAAATTDRVVNGIRKAMFSKPSVEILFTITSDGASTQGAAVLQEAMFTFDTPAFMAWYDGNTQWAYQRASEEVSISEPTAEEIMALNPFGLLAHPETFYNVSEFKRKDAQSAIQLVPKSKGTGIASIVVDYDALTYTPKAIEITFDDRRTMRMSIDRLIPGAKLPVSTFRYNPQLHPAREIIDLR